MARPRALESSSTSTSTVGFPRESSTSRPITSTIVLIGPLTSPRAAARPRARVTTVAEVTSEPTSEGPTPGGTDAPGPPVGDLPVFDPFADGFAADPYPQYRRLCREHPVQQSPLGPWFVFGY